MRKIKILKNDHELCQFELDGQKFDVVIESEIGDDIMQVYKLGNIDILDDKIKTSADYWKIEYKNLRKNGNE